MVDRVSVQDWLEKYVRAWKSYDPHAIGDLYTEDATYYFDPYSAPVHGRDAIVTAWLEEDRRDAPGTYDGQYEPVLISGDRAVATGHSRYYEVDGRTLRTEYSNIFLLRFREDGRCSEYREWYMEQPTERD